MGSTYRRGGFLGRGGEVYRQDVAQFFDLDDSRTNGSRANAVSADSRKAISKRYLDSGLNRELFPHRENRTRGHATLWNPVD